MNFLPLKTTKCLTVKKINKRTCNKIDKNQNCKIKSEFARKQIRFKICKITVICTLQRLC